MFCPHATLTARIQCDELTKHVQVQQNQITAITALLKDKEAEEKRAKEERDKEERTERISQGR